MHVFLDSSCCTFRLLLSHCSFRAPVANAGSSPFLCDDFAATQLLIGGVSCSSPFLKYSLSFEINGENSFLQVSFTTKKLQIGFSFPYLFEAPTKRDFFVPLRPAFYFVPHGYAHLLSILRFCFDRSMRFPQVLGFFFFFFLVLRCSSFFLPNVSVFCRHVFSFTSLSPVPPNITSSLTDQGMTATFEMLARAYSSFVLDPIVQMDFLFNVFEPPQANTTESRHEITILCVGFLLLSSFFSVFFFGFFFFAPAMSRSLQLSLL